MKTTASRCGWSLAAKAAGWSQAPAYAGAMHHPPLPSTFTPLITIISLTAEAKMPMGKHLMEFSVGETPKVARKRIPP
jgi:hypothetical protein